MRIFTRVLVVCGILLILIVSYVASTRGVGIASLTDKQIVEETKTKSGSGGGRSYFAGRTIRGGGPRYGK